MSQYLQRLGGHLEEATSNLERILNSSVYQNMEELVRRTLELEAITRVDNLQKAYDTINGASFLTKPFKLLFVIEEKIFLGTINDYVPSFNFTLGTIFHIIYDNLGSGHILTKMAPLERGDSQLSIRFWIVKIRYILRKLWTILVRAIFSLKFFAQNPMQVFFPIFKKLVSLGLYITS